jgi:hypothetical protein
LTFATKEGSADSIDVHDDDPEAFQAMMKFFYHPKFETPAPIINSPTTSASKTETLVSIIGFHALAEKYEATLFLAASADAFKQVSATYQRPLTEIDLESLVHAHYPYCTRTLCEMSEVIVSFFIENNCTFNFRSKINELAMLYGNFGADMLILGMRNGAVKIVRR